MTEISTNDVNPVESSNNDPLSATADLEPHEKHFYKLLLLQLDTIQLFPKKETVLKIITYSRSKR